MNLMTCSYISVATFLVSIYMHDFTEFIQLNYCAVGLG